MNPWEAMSHDEGRAMDRRKDKGPARHQAALKRELI